MRWHHFLCCLPLRVGVILIALVTSLLSGAVAASSWYLVHLAKTDDEFNLPKDYMTAMYVVAGVYTAITLICVMGLIGGLAAKRGLVSAFSALQIGSFVVSLAAGIYALYMIFSGKYEDLCNDQSTDQDVQQFCVDIPQSSKTATAVVYSIYWVVQFYGVFIVHSYSQELKEKRFAGVKYAHVGGKDGYVQTV